MKPGVNNRTTSWDRRREVGGQFLALLAATVMALASSVSPRPLRAEDTKEKTATSISKPPNETPAVAADDTIIFSDDVVLIQVFDVDSMSREYRISATGMLTVPPLPHSIKAAGLTCDQLAAVLAQNLRDSGMLTNPQITVTLRESRHHSVVVAGAVKRPQIYPVFGHTTLLDVISQAEGLADDASPEAVVTRGEVAMRTLAMVQSGDSSDSFPPAQIVKVDLKRLQDTGDPALNLVLYPGDRVVVQRAGVIYVVGAVNRAGGYPLKDDQDTVTVLKAVALANDVKPTAVRKKTVIIRKDPQTGAREEIPVNLERILDGHAPDQTMEANDILFIPDSQAARAMRRAAEVAVQTASGLLIWHLP